MNALRHPTRAENRDDDNGDDDDDDDDDEDDDDENADTNNNDSSDSKARQQSGVVFDDESASRVFNGDMTAVSFVLASEVAPSAESVSAFSADIGFAAGVCDLRLPPVSGDFTVTDVDSLGSTVD